MNAFDDVSHELVGATIVSVTGDGYDLILDDGRRIKVGDPYSVRIEEGDS